MRWSSSPRAIAATPSASCRTGRVMRRATIAVARPPSTRATTASAASSRRVPEISASIRWRERAIRTVPQRLPSTRIGTAMS